MNPKYLRKVNGARLERVSKFPGTPGHHSDHLGNFIQDAARLGRKLYRPLRPSVQARLDWLRSGKVLPEPEKPEELPQEHYAGRPIKPKVIKVKHERNKLNVKIKHTKEDRNMAFFAKAEALKLRPGLLTGTSVRLLLPFYIVSPG